jgi:hypothetical protein
MDPVFLFLDAADKGATGEKNFIVKRTNLVEMVYLWRKTKRKS